MKQPTEKLHGQLIDKERTLRSLDLQLKHLTGGEGLVVSTLRPIFRPVCGLWIV